MTAQNIFVAKAVKHIVWDKAPVADTGGMDAVDGSLRDLMGADHPRLACVPFGGMSWNQWLSSKAPHEVSQRPIDSFDAEWIRHRRFVPDDELYGLGHLSKMFWAVNPHALACQNRP